METTKQVQVSIFLENKPGRLANLLSALAREKINILALTVMESHDQRVLRVVTSDPTRSLQVLNGLGVRHAQTEVLAVELRNQPGALANVCEKMGVEHINIDYAYCSAGGRNGKTLGIFKVSSAEKAMKVLSGPPDVATRRRLDTRPTRSKRAYAARPAANSLR
jgi:hypothetical protein